MSIFDFFRRKQSIENTGDVLNEKNVRWNKFIENICFRDLDTLTDVQRKAVLCFWYDVEMNSGGYSGYMDCYPNTDKEELADAIRTIAYKEIADNYLTAVEECESDSWVKTDMAYYEFFPSLSDCLMEYVEKNKDVISD